MSKLPTSRKGLILVISAPSGAGKTTLIKRLVQEFPNFGFSISCTTRSPRAGEIDGQDYHFITQEEFIAKRDAGEFAEWAKVHNNYYASPLKPTLTMLENGQDVIFDVDVQGVEQLRQTLPHATYIFIMPPSLEILKERLYTRGSENAQSLEKRIQNSIYEMQQAHKFDYVLINDDLEQAYDALRCIFIANTLRPTYNKEIFENIIP